MSLKVMNHVWTRSKASGSALLALLAIADCADDQGIAYPSQATIARKARISERNLKRIISELCSTREMEILERGDGRRSTTYQILMKNDEGCQDGPPQMSQNVDFEGGQDGPPGVTNRENPNPTSKIEGGHHVLPGVTQLRPPRGDTAMSPKQSYNGHGTKEFPITPFRGTKTSAEANSEASQGIPQADPNAEGVSQNSFFPEAQSGANVEVEILPPPPPFEAANAVKENANFVRSALSDGEEVQKSSTVRTCEPSTRSESVPSGTASEKKDYSTGKEDFQVNGTDLVLRLNRLFGRPERATFESDEQRILKGSKCPSFWNSDLCNLEKWIQLPSTYRTYFPKSLKRLLNQWGKSCDWARHNIAEFEQIQSSKSDSKNSKTVIVTPLAYLESIPHLMPDSQTEAESEFQVFIENLARTISKSSVDRWLSKATPIGLRVDDNALVLKAENQFSASFIMENYKTQIIHAAGSRKVVICI